MNESSTFLDLIKTGHELLHDGKFENALSLMTDHINLKIGAERSSIFLHNKHTNELWTILSTGIEKIHVPTEKGIVGYVFRTKESVIENNVNKNVYFLSEIDKTSGYVTRNIVACPIFNSKREVIGVLELLNKSTLFDEKDLDFVNIFAHYIGTLIELAPYYLEDED
jgi:GAF domain-containing protein